jgi:hypothetical protein
MFAVLAEFLAVASEFYEVPPCGIRVLAARPLRVREHWTSELFGDYSPETMLIRVWSSWHKPPLEWPLRRGLLARATPACKEVVCNRAENTCTAAPFLAEQKVQKAP